MQHPLANALVVVNVQEDFTSDVPHGDLIVAHIREFLRDHEDNYLAIVSVRDIDAGQDHSNLQDYEFDKVFLTETFSGFDGTVDGSTVRPRGWERAQVNLDNYLKRLKVGHLDLAGLPFEGGIKETAVAGVKLGYDISVLTTMCAGKTRLTSSMAIENMRNIGVHIDGWQD